MKWSEYLQEQKSELLRQIDLLESGDVELTATTAGVASDITAEQLGKLKSQVAQIRQVFIDEGIAP